MTTRRSQPRSRSLRDQLEMQSIHDVRISISSLRLQLRLCLSSIFVCPYLQRTRLWMEIAILHFLPLGQPLLDKLIKHSGATRITPGSLSMPMTSLSPLGQMGRDFFFAVGTRKCLCIPPKLSFRTCQSVERSGRTQLSYLTAT